MLLVFSKGVQPTHIIFKWIISSDDGWVRKIK